MITETDLDENLTRKLNRLTNDADALFELITSFQTDTDARFRSIEDRITSFQTDTDARFRNVEDRLGGIEERMDRIESMLAAILLRLPPVAPT